jgi:hypothetical protein
MKIKANAVDPGHFQDLKRSCGFFKKKSAFLERISIFRKNSLIKSTLFYDLSKVIQSVVLQLSF